MTNTTDLSTLAVPQESTTKEIYVQVFEQWTSFPGGGWSLRKSIDFKTVEVVPHQLPRYDELLSEATSKTLPGHYSKAYGKRAWGWYETIEVPAPTLTGSCE